MNIIKVKFEFSDSGFAKDIYKGIEDKRLYSRSPNLNWCVCTDDGEPCYPIKNVKFQVMGHKEILFEENSDIAKSENYPFTWDIGQRFKEKIMKDYDLIEYDLWRNKLKDLYEENKCNDYLDNWIYCNDYVETVNTTIVFQFKLYDIKFSIVCEEIKHKKCDLKWDYWHCINEKDKNTMSIYGYKVYVK